MLARVRRASKAVGNASKIMSLSNGRGVPGNKFYHRPAKTGEGWEKNR